MPPFQASRASAVIKNRATFHVITQRILVCPALLHDRFCAIAFVLLARLSIVNVSECLTAMCQTHLHLGYVVYALRSNSLL